MKKISNKIIRKLIYLKTVFVIFSLCILGNIDLLEKINILKPETIYAANDYTYSTSTDTFKYQINSDYTIKICDYEGTSNKLVIPETINGKKVTSIMGMAFRGCNNISSVTLPANLKSIETFAFYGCTNLKSVNIPCNVETIGDNPFCGCENLESITVDSNNKFFDSRNGCNAVIRKSDNSLIIGCKNSIIPNTVNKIGDKAFRCCYGLEYIDIPVGVTEIGYESFWECKNLKKLNIPEGVEIINQSAFSYCELLDNVEFPKSLKKIDYRAFLGCNRFTKIYIPEGVEDICPRAFNSSNSIESIIVDDNNSYYDSRDNCNAIINKSDNSLLLGCKNTIIPEGVKSIEKWCFSGNEGLISIDIPNTVTTIDMDAFSACINLKKITIPRSVTYIDNNGVFGGCTKLRIYCEIESYALSYALKNGFNCEVICLHSNTKKIVNNATLTNDGSVITKCSECGKIIKNTVIKKVNSITLSATSYKYDGKSKKPAVTVKDSAGNKISSTKYTVVYDSDTKSAGVHSVKVTFKGDYDGSKTLTYTINDTTPNISYRTHVQTFGWQSFVKSGAVSGTSGQAKRLEGIEIKLENQPYSGGITYRTHVQTYGWQGWKSNGAMSGTSGQAKRLEAIEIKLTGEMAKQYDVYYRVHAQKFGWMNWAKNGESAGTSGYAYRLEAIQIVLVKKGSAAPAKTYSGIISTNAKAYIKK